MHLADIVYFHRRSITRNFAEGWWLLPAMAIGAAFWSAVVYAILT